MPVSSLVIISSNTITHDPSKDAACNIPLAMKYSLIEGFDGRTSCIPPINVRSRSNVCLREAHFVYHTEVKFMTFQ